MALCLAESLVTQGGFDPADQMERYLRWRTEGHWSSTGVCFDIGNTTSAALSRYRQTGDPFSGSADPRSAGNGCIMRLAPVPIFYHRTPGQAIHYSGESSRTTHGAQECVDASRLFGAILLRAFQGQEKEAILFDPFELGPLSPKIAAIAQGSYREKRREEIRGSGSVVESLEAALWCFWQTKNFVEAVLVAANLGDDADTTAAICGQIAGAYYGVDAIPESWRQKLVMVEEIQTLTERLIAGTALV
jgi:ADP-ribosyl-[dinitrogen reductase] hydrolase